MVISNCTAQILIYSMLLFLNLVLFISLNTLMNNFCIEPETINLLKNKPLGILFPGQGVQTIGMNKTTSEIENNQSLISQAKNYIDIDIKKLIIAGPKEELDLTENAQVAIFCATLDSWFKFHSMVFII